MKSFRLRLNAVPSPFVLAAAVLLPVALIFLPTLASAQSDAQNLAQPKPPLTVPSTDAHNMAQSEASATAPTSEAQTAFAAMKTLAGDWEGAVKTDMPMDPKADMKPLHVSMRVTSRGNVLVHEFQEAGTPLDATKYDHPVTMMYVDDAAEKLTLVHYCDAGNRPRMTGKMSPDGKTLEFDFADLSGSNKHGHMYHAVFTLIDADHHTEEWTYMMPGDKAIRAHVDLQRTK